MPAERCDCGTPCDAWEERGEGQMRCPRCREPLARVALDVGALHVDECPRCLGSFAHARHFSELLDREVAGEAVGLQRFVPPRPGRELPQETLLRPVDCPHCGREMERIRFAQRASLVVDVCPPHGVWLDAAELVALVSFVKARTEGAVPPGPAELEDEAKWKQITARVAEEGRVVNLYTSLAEQHIRDQRKNNPSY
jgi:Zn-finger nucleic acid-binding protein